jgi:hypothetical protein
MKEELIQKFREQSMITRDTEWGENVQFFDYRIFAKLIVEECLDIVDNETRGNWGDSIEIWHEIKERFGVE